MTLIHWVIIYFVIGICLDLFIGWGGSTISRSDDLSLFKNPAEERVLRICMLFLWLPIIVLGLLILWIEKLCKHDGGYGD